MHLKFAKSANMTKKNFFIKISMRYQKMQTYMLIPNSLEWAKKDQEKCYLQKTKRILSFLGCHTLKCFAPTDYQLILI
jgi:hypothetical protein